MAEILIGTSQATFRFDSVDDPWRVFIGHLLHLEDTLFKKATDLSLTLDKMVEDNPDDHLLFCIPIFPSDLGM